MSESKVRESNMELLRIVSMLMVVLVHIDGASLGLPAFNGNFPMLAARDVWRLGIESLTIIGVNCFTLISGYFGIKLRWKGLGAFLFQCVFYSVLISTIVPRVIGLEFSWTRWGESWLVLSHTDLWYVPAYFCLMLISPLLNAGVRALDRRQFSMFLAVFLLFNVWSGWWWGGSFNPTGYTVIQLVLMYLIGRFLRRETEAAAATVTFWDKGRLFLAAYFLSVALIFLSALYLQPAKAFAYNSPAVILASVSFFLFFRSLSFRSAAVNYVARSAFSVYLIHKSPEIWGNVLRPQVSSLWQTLSLPGFTCVAVIMTLGIYLFSMLVDPFRRRLWNIFRL